MTAFGRYFLYRLKSSLWRTVFLTLLSLVFALSVADDCTSAQTVEYKTTGIYILALILGVFATLIPILELSGFKNRRNLDTLYFFPISRGKLALVHYLSGLAQIFVIYSVSFFSVWAFLAINTNCFALGYMIAYYALSLILGLVIYSVIAFIFTEANTVIDGIIFCGLWALVLFLIIWTVRVEFVRDLIIETRYWEETSDLASWGTLYTPINNLTVIFQDLIEVNRTGEAAIYDYTAINAERYMKQMYMFFIWGGIGIAAAIGYFISFTKREAQAAGEISTSIFGYRLLIPLYGYMLLLVYNEIDIMTVVIVALMLVGYIIYRRGIRLKRSDVILTACAIIPILFNYFVR